MSVATEIVRFARSKIGTIVKYGKKPKGKCEELVYKVLDEAKADMGLNVIGGKLGDIAIFSNHKGTVTFEVLASSKPKENLSVLDFDADFARGNHIGIVSKGPDANGKIFLLEQNVGKSKKVTESPVNTRNQVSYSRKFPASTPYTRFKNELTALIRCEFTVEKADQALKKSVDWKTLKLWCDSPQKYVFTIKVSYSGSGTIKYKRPHKK